MPTNRRDISTAIKTGIVTANDAYTRMSGGLWLSDAGVESFMATHIALQVFKTARALDPDAYVTLETALSEIAEASDANPRRGRPAKVFEGRPQVDLVLWSGDAPVAAVELKRHANWTGVDKDCERVAALVDRYGEEQGGTLEFGAVAFFMARSRDPDQTKIQAYYDDVADLLMPWRPEGLEIDRITPAPADTSLVDESYADYSVGGMVITVYQPAR